ncbi:hypothetical protein ABH905_003940 [Pseudomonas frederiksbergensis]
MKPFKVMIVDHRMPKVMKTMQQTIPSTRSKLSADD